MMEFARVARMQLAGVPAHLWAIWYVELRLQFTRAYSQGPCSMAHGIEFFDHVLAGPKNWKEPGVYGDNFRQLANHI